MRTTITLDDDVAAKLGAETRRTGASLKQVVNEHLRLAFALRRDLRRQPPFVVKAQPLQLRPGFDYDNIGELLEELEGSEHR